MIKNYSKMTGSKFSIYADPQQQLYKLFDLNRTLSSGPKKPDYISFGIGTAIWKGVVNSIKSGSGIFKTGDIQQVGGEYKKETEFADM